MTSPGFHSDLDDCLRKIQEGLQIEKKWQSDDEASAIRVKSRGRGTFDEIRDEFDEMECDLMRGSKISVGYPFRDLIDKYHSYTNQIIDDDKLFEAILCARIYESPAQYDSSHHIYNEKLVWVPDGFYYLVHADSSIIYHMEEQNFEKIRKFTQKIWESLRKNVLCNLKLSFGIESDEDHSESSSQSSEEDFSPPGTDAVRTHILDELNSINPDPLLRRQFEFDMKTLTGKNTYFWRDRLELVRICSRSATSSEKLLVQTVSDLEKIARQNESFLATIVDAKRAAGRDLPKTISKFEQLVKDNEKQLGIMSNTILELAEIVKGQAASRQVESEQLQQLVKTMPSIGEVKKQKEAVATLARGKDVHTATDSDGSSAGGSAGGSSKDSGDQEAKVEEKPKPSRGRKKQLPEGSPTKQVSKKRKAAEKSTK